jgi:hypothetical protein
MLAVAGLASIGYFAIIGAFGQRTVTAQTDTFLARRVDQLEQRFYMLESRLNRAEQDVRRPSTINSTLSDPQAVEIQSLRTQIESLRTRIGELECGLLRVDERTLPTTRTTRGNLLAQDPCRREPNFPVKLSVRPGS